MNLLEIDDLESQVERLLETNDPVLAAFWTGVATGVCQLPLLRLASELVQA